LHRFGTPIPYPGVAKSSITKSTNKSSPYSHRKATSPIRRNQENNIKHENTIKKHTRNPKDISSNGTKETKKPTLLCTKQSPSNKVIKKKSHTTPSATSITPDKPSIPLTYNKSQKNEQANLQSKPSFVKQSGDTKLKSNNLNTLQPAAYQTKKLTNNVEKKMLFDLKRNKTIEGRGLHQNNKNDETKEEVKKAEENVNVVSTFKECVAIGGNHEVEKKMNVAHESRIKSNSCMSKDIETCEQNIDKKKDKQKSALESADYAASDNISGSSEDIQEHADQAYIENAMYKTLLKKKSCGEYIEGDEEKQTCELETKHVTISSINSFDICAKNKEGESANKVVLGKKNEEVVEKKRNEQSRFCKVSSFSVDDNVISE
ncbi:hypothetical protein CDIK_4353, partial [Cucumispora dikerogammari]